MGTWDTGTFDNDSAADFVAEFEGIDREEGVELVTDAIEAVFDGVEYYDASDDGGDEAETEDADADEGDEDLYVDSDIAVAALVACEAIARLAGQGGEASAYSEALDAWVGQHPGPIDKSLARRALEAIDRITGENSELAELWEGDAGWLAQVADLRGRVALAAA